MHSFFSTVRRAENGAGCRAPSQLRRRKGWPHRRTLPRPRGGSPQAAKAWRRSRFLVRAQKERNTSLPACGVQSFSAKAWRKKAPELLSPVRAKERTAGNRLKANFGGFPLCARKKIGTESGLIRPRRLCPGHSPRAGTSGVRGATRCRKTTPSGALSGCPTSPRINAVAEPRPLRQHSAPQRIKKGRSSLPPIFPRLFVPSEPRTGRSTPSARGLLKWRPPRDRHSVRTPFLRFPPWPPADRRDRPAPPRSR